MSTESVVAGVTEVTGPVMRPDSVAEAMTAAETDPTAVTGQTVVVIATVAVMTKPPAEFRAGQLVTDAAHEATVRT